MTPVLQLHNFMLQSLDNEVARHFNILALFFHSAPNSLFLLVLRSAHDLTK